MIKDFLTAYQIFFNPSRVFKKIAALWSINKVLSWLLLNLLIFFVIDISYGISKYSFEYISLTFGRCLKYWTIDILLFLFFLNIGVVATNFLALKMGSQNRLKKLFICSLFFLGAIFFLKSIIEFITLLLHIDFLLYTIVKITVNIMLIYSMVKVIYELSKVKIFLITMLFYLIINPLYYLFINFLHGKF